MGMYNEIWCTCPKCGGSAYTQIAQVVLGFGNFHLENFNDLAERLTVDELHELKERVLETNFRCQNEKCEHYFNPYKNQSSRKELAEELFRYERY